MCCTWLAGNTGRKNCTKNRHLRTIAQLCWAISMQLSHVSTIRKKFVKQQYLLQTSPQYGELRPIDGQDFGSLEHPSKFQRVSRSWLHYCSDVAHRRPTKLYTMFGHLLGWYTIYTFSGAFASWRNFAMCKIHFVSIYAPSHKFLGLYLRY